MLTLEDAIAQVDIFCKSFEDKSMIRWGIELKENKKIIGTCGFFAFSEDRRFFNILGKTLLR